MSAAYKSKSSLVYEEKTYPYSFMDGENKWQIPVSNPNLFVVVQNLDLFSLFHNYFLKLKIIRYLQYAIIL